MKKLLIATFNNGKIKDYKEFLSDLPLALVTLSDLGIQQDFDEVFDTFEENARAKAEFYAKLSGLPALSDDSGIEIPYYDMGPGVHTKRWNGDDFDEERYINFIVNKIKAIPADRREAQLRAVLALYINGKIYLSETKIKGYLTPVVYKGSTKDYPWDKVFIIPEENKYYEELDDEENYKYSHRRIGLERLQNTIKEELL